MKTIQTSPKIITLLDLYDMHTGFFPRAIEGISDKDAHNRMSTKANHIAWLSGSLVQQRFALANDLDIDKKQQADELFKDYKGIQEGVTYPPLSTFLNDWEIISPILRDALAAVSDEKLESPFEMEPEMEMTYYDLFTFSTYREANQIGQIALYRRLLGYDAMKYEGM